uniref:Transmembrane protein 231 n=1 Tax=Heliothis virescens TaxID=7102 RepID=A0A2A4JJQ7_HELVI
MDLYKLFSYNVEVQYVGCLMSKATLFTLTTSFLNLILPFLIAYRGRGFWLRSHSFYEQPVIHFPYEYLLVVETDDPSKPIECGDTNGKYGNFLKNEENCMELQVQEYDLNGDSKTDLLDFKFILDIPNGRTVKSILMIFILDFQLKTVCPLHMQSLALVNKEFATPPSGFKYFADLQFYQTSHLPCKQNLIHTKYNNSLFNFEKSNNENAIDNILENYFVREAYRGRGFWLRSHSFYEQPVIHFPYEYLLVVETDDPSKPIECGDTNGKYGNFLKNEENCMELQVQEYDLNGDSKTDLLDFKFILDIPNGRTVKSILMIFILDFQLKTVCPLHMQSLALVNKEFATPPSGFKYFADLQFYQTSHLPCKQNLIHTKYNNSLFNFEKSNNENAIDNILENYFVREVTTHTNTLFSRSQNGHTGLMQIQISLRVPEMEIRYLPSFIQELKWAWPQYLSLVFIFYLIFDKIKRFVFQNRLVMAWEIMPWKKSQSATGTRKKF